MITGKLEIYTIMAKTCAHKSIAIPNIRGVTFCLHWRRRPVTLAEEDAWFINWSVTFLSRASVPVIYQPDVHKRILNIRILRTSRSCIIQERQCMVTDSFQWVVFHTFRPIRRWLTTDFFIGRAVMSNCELVVVDNERKNCMLKNVGTEKVRSNVNLIRRHITEIAHIYWCHSNVISLITVTRVPDDTCDTNNIVYFLI